MCVLNTQAIANLHIGTSGWSYKHWYGLFYPEHIKPANFLEYYLSFFSCVELNTSFYHLPKDSTVTGWLKRTPESFRFCPKLSRFITHQKRLMDCEEALKNYFDRLGLMQERLGPILIQLPPGLSYNKKATESFLWLLKEHYSPYRFAMEIRHKSWLNDEFMQLLSDFQIVFVIADSGKRFPYYETVTTNLIYLRFHGREQLYASDYSEEDLMHYAEKIVQWLQEDQEVWVFFNNDFRGYAVKNALRLKEIIHTATL